MATDYNEISRNPRINYRDTFTPYSDKTHFIYELVQNADDNKSQSIELQLYENELLVWNDGCQFTEEDVRSICSIGFSNKDLTQIGTFGMGFKAVYAYTDSPEVYSGDECFRISIKDPTKPEGIYKITPEIAKLIDDDKTVFRLPFMGNLRQEEEIALLKDRLCTLEKRSLLFLRNLKMVHWRDESDGQMGSYSCHRLPHNKIQGVYEVELKASLNGEDQSSETFLVFRKKIQPPQMVIDELLRQSPDDDKRQRIQKSADKLQPIEVAFKIQDGKITTMNNCVLFSYLPTEKETHLRFFIQASYKPTLARDNIKRRNQWNEWLVQETANFLPDVLEQLKDDGWLEPEFFNVLPLETDNVPEEFALITDALQKAMQERTLIPIQDGGYAKAENVYSPHAENLRKLVESSELYPNSSWLHPDIGRSGRTFEVMTEAGVKEINIREVLNWLEKQDLRWFEGRCEEWLRSLYIYLRTQKAELDRIKKLPLVRLENGQHVCASDNLVFFPPDADEDQQKIQPFLKELPILQIALLEGDNRNDIEAFLKDIGVRALKPEELIEEWIFPQYSQPAKPSVSQNRLHVQYIFRVWDELSGYKHKDLRKKISKTPILRAYSSVQPEVYAFVKPYTAYLPQAYTGDNNLETYFSVCNEGVWFVDTAYLGVNSEVKDWLQFLRVIGTMDTPRVVKKEVPGNTKECQKRGIPRTRSTKPFENGQFITSVRTGNYDGVIIDLDFDGLPAVLDQISNPEESKLSIAFWDLLVKRIKPLSSEKSSLSGSKRDKFFQGMYRWFHQKGRSKSFEATFYRQLKATAWLPDEQGNFHVPSECFAPTNENRKLLGDTVPYLHPDFDVSQENEAARWLAEKLEIHLNANTDSVLNYLQTLSGTAVSLDKVEPLYRCLENRARRPEEFKEKPFIFTSEPEPHWWKADEVFWEDESPVFGNDRGYLAKHYPKTLKSFFTAQGVTERAAPLDYVRGIQAVADAGQTDEAVHERIKILYNRLWNSLQGGGKWQETDEWQDVREGRCCLGRKGNTYGFFTRQELVLKDHPHIAEVFEGKVPFWAFDDLVDLAKNLEIEGCSQAEAKFCPTGQQEEDPDGSVKVQQLHPDIRAFLNSPALCDKAADEVKPTDVLDRISVRWVEELKVTYTLKGFSLPNPNPGSSFLESADQESTLWLALAADKDEYAEIVGDAFQYYFDVKELSSFVEDLLKKNRSKVLDRWKQKGLDTDLCVPLPDTDVTDDSEEAPESLDADRIFSRPEIESESTEAAAIDSEGYTEHLPHTNGANQDEGQSLDESDSGYVPGEGESEVVTPVGHKEPESEGSSSNVSGSSSNISGMSRVEHSGGHWAGTSSGSTDSGSGGHSSRGGGGEGTAHRTLKEYLADDPSQLGEGLKLIEIEHRFKSGDKVDILLENSSGHPVTVEVETHIRSENEDYVGVWQAVKYQHLAAMEYSLPCEEVRSILAAPKIPDDVKVECKRLGIEPIEVSDQSE